MRLTKLLKYVWATLDGFLILLALTLMAAISLAPKLSSGVLKRSRKESELIKAQADQLADRHTAEDSWRRRSMSVAPVAYERSRAAQIARNMVFSESMKLPIRPALDMREKGETYEVRFALPRGTDADNVSVKVAGDILTLIMHSENRAFMRRIRIPCDYADKSTLRHSVSNHVLYVEITREDFR